jgi:hypothetical protein
MKAGKKCCAIIKAGPIESLHLAPLQAWQAGTKGEARERFNEVRHVGRLQGLLVRSSLLLLRLHIAQLEAPSEQCAITESTTFIQVGAVFLRASDLNQHERLVTAIAKRLAGSTARRKQTYHEQ